jgi:hypothetical protein
MRIIGCVMPPLIWHISQIIVDVLFLIVNACVLNQSYGHWLLFDALNATMIMSLKLKEEYGISSNLKDLIANNSIVALELSLLASNIRRKICGVLDGFLSFLKKLNEKNKAHNMSFMLDPKFKSLRLVSFIISQEHVSIVEKYDKHFLFPMLLKCYHIIHLMAKLAHVANTQIDEKNSFNIFEMSAKKSEPTKEVVNKELQMSRKCQVDVKDIKCPLEWWVKHEYLFPSVTFFAH